ncbi:MAG TPA: hypothetical protein VMV41_09470 [Cellulomonadaceae bacterium]|nr:hypothetical protein [Cellulomonadaceae bacterium]
MRDEKELRVEVSDADIHLATADWLAARDGGLPEVIVADAFDVYRSLISAQAQQLADEFRRLRS